MAKEKIKTAKGAKRNNENGWGKRYGYQYQSPGNGVGKNLNRIDADWYNVWGAGYTCDYDYYNGVYTNWNDGDQNGRLGYMAMMLEKGKNGEMQRELHDQHVQTTTANEFVIKSAEKMQSL